ncbi:hypothetical protein BDV98DRAFT_576226, partial [Pterulicium gracile]
VSSSDPSSAHPFPRSFANPSLTFLVPHHQIVGIITPVETTLLVERNCQVDQLHVLITDL